jgi:hypothetical protein
VDRAALADRLVEHDALGHRRLPDRAPSDDAHQFVDPALGLRRDGRHPVEHDPDSSSSGLVVSHTSSIASATPPMPRSPSADGSTTTSACRDAVSALRVSVPSDGGQSISTAS